ncbi:hypothetical protein CAL29_23620 [Bordetella genomosp. 10]|uniref:DKNYY family protein n=1 Tax=Bordetella genomosp. 10 TaxID=1416804 RepID=A0A261S0T1_9BORD|nr:DKNYY domain-containing protein [Bordetella genomosp. 10]OZI30948.1 hypothetical protein CAL29_23620 [Bordetella genomosp. 10]
MTAMTLLKLPIVVCLLALLALLLLLVKRSRMSRGQEGSAAGRAGIKPWLLAPAFLAVAAAFTVSILLSRSTGQDAASNGESLGPGIYARYQGRIYMNIGGQGEYLLPDADAASFGPFPDHELDSRNIGRDRNAVYCGSQAIVQLRPEQVRFVGHGYVSDGNRAWYCTWEKDNASYHWWQDILNSRDEDSPEKPRFRDYVLVPLEPVHAADLKIVNAAYAQDGVHAYYEGRLIAGADGASLQTVKVTSGQDHPEGYTDDHYVRDGRHVYFDGVPLPEAHPAAFLAFMPDSDQWNTRYGLDKATGQFYAGATPFPAKVDGVDSSALHLLVADRDRANHELFYNASGIWFWDYQDQALKRGCAYPFAGTPTMLSSGIWIDGRNAFFSRTIDDWRNGRNDKSLAARKTQLWMLPDAELTKVADLPGKNGHVRGTLWKGGAQLYFAPSIGQNYFLHDALYLVRNEEGLKRDLLTDHYYVTIFKSEDVERLDSSDSTVVCRMSSDYPSMWAFWK